METEAFVAEPFRDLDNLYSKLDELTPWPETKKLRESTEYVYSGNQAAVQTGKLTRLDRDLQPRSIICHDMKGGYLEDRFINGSTANDSYLFYHWNVIDTFVYFSHKMVTIPPYGWINAAHAHGVKVLGTVITEREDGERIWERVLSNREETRKFANALIRVAIFYGFEGWLLNVENKIKSSDIEELIYFVKYLTEGIHDAIEGSEIIWYDSVTHEGQLKWQNELNLHNDRFFDNCDGIFLNYNWSDSRLTRSRIIAQRNQRTRDVYVGLDVWGRGCPGGGGFNSAHAAAEKYYDIQFGSVHVFTINSHYLNINTDVFICVPPYPVFQNHMILRLKCKQKFPQALERIRKQHLSVAIFAPGWTHEYFGPDTFHKIECIFWAQLFPHLYVHVPIYDKGDFITSFCRGAGINNYRLGQLEPIISTDNGINTTNSFYNLSMQKIQILAPGLHTKFTYIDIPPYIEPEDKNAPKKVQPECTFETALEVLKVNGKKITFIEKNSTLPLNYLDYCKEYSYNGGGCLTLITKDVTLHHRLFLIHIDFYREIQASLIYKENESFIEETNTFTEGPDLILGNESGMQRIRSFNTVELNSGWKKNVYLTNLRTINEIGVICSRIGSCYLGELVIEPKQQRFGLRTAENLASVYSWNQL